MREQENKVRLQEEYKKHKLVEKRRRQAKQVSGTSRAHIYTRYQHVVLTARVMQPQEIVLKALGETSDLEALRR